MEIILVSVLMTSFNRELFIAEAIESVLNSDYPHFELIIVDDRSTDNTVNIANTYAEKDHRVKIYINEKNLGDYSNRNRAASYAKGKYIKYCDSDDKLYDWTLTYCVGMMEKYPDAAVGYLYTHGIIKDEYLLPAQSIHKSYFESTILNIGPCGTILNRSLFEKAGGYDDRYGPVSDMYFNLKMATMFPIVLLEKEFFFYRRHEGQEINNRYKYLLNNYRYLKDAFCLPGFPLDKHQRKFLLRREGYWQTRELLLYVRKTGDFRKAIEAIQKSTLGVAGFIGGVKTLLLHKLKMKTPYQ